jgi:hypothetical protein
MVTEYPDIISFTSSQVITEPYQDEKGDWVIPEPGEMLTVSQAGRAEVNSQAVKVPGQNGEKVDFSFMVYLPVDAVEIPYQTQVTIKNDKGETIGKSDVKRFHRATMNARCWI